MLGIANFSKLLFVLISLTPVRLVSKLLAKFDIKPLREELGGVSGVSVLVETLTMDSTRDLTSAGS